MAHVGQHMALPAVRRPMILPGEFTSTMPNPQATVKHRVKIDRRQLWSHHRWSTYRIQSTPSDAHWGEESSKEGGPAIGERGDPREGTMVSQPGIWWDDGIKDPVRWRRKDLGSNHKSASSLCKYYGRELKYLWCTPESTCSRLFN